MSKRETFLQLHERLLNEGLSLYGHYDTGGLCFQLFNGIRLDFNDTFKLFIEHDIGGYWGYRGMEDYFADYKNLAMKTKYTAIRQNIILLCAAINNEL